MNKICIAAVAIINVKKELLLVRKKSSTYFQLVGGKINLNESFEQTVIRETEEEIGLILDPKKLKKIGTHKTQAVNEQNTLVEGHVYYLFLEDTFNPQIANEIEEYVWINTNNYKKYKWAHLALEYVFPFWFNQINN